MEQPSAHALRLCAIPGLRSFGSGSGCQTVALERGGCHGLSSGRLDAPSGRIHAPVHDRAAEVASESVVTRF